LISNWLDVLLLLILAVLFILGLFKGFVRQLIGLALLFAPLAARDVFSHFLAFAAIFLIFLCLGWLISRIIGRFVKGPLKFFNHVLGGVLGILKGILLCGIICFSLLVFPVTTGVLKESTLAPLCLKMTRYVVRLIPQELKDRFNQTYHEIVEKRGKNEQGI